MNGFLAVALGGALGAMLRYGAGIVAALFTAAPGLHVTFFVNILGSAFMGILLAWLVSRDQSAMTEGIYLLIGVGLLGGFTTFSAFSLELFQMLDKGAAFRATSYALLSVLGGVTALFAAFVIMRRVIG